MAVMDKNQVERSFIEKCSKLSFQELSDYIEKCFNKLQTIETSEKNIPVNKETYDELTNLLEGKRKDLLINNNYGGQRLGEIAEREKRKDEISAEEAQNSQQFLKELELAKKNLTALRIDKSYYQRKWEQFEREVKELKNHESCF